MVNKASLAYIKFLKRRYKHEMHRKGIEMKIKLPVKTEMEFNVKTVHINAKCSDLCYTVLYDANGKEILEHDGYVPGFFPGRGGDYVELDIDIDTGKILNWKVDKQYLSDFIEEHYEENTDE